MTIRLTPAASFILIFLLTALLPGQILRAQDCNNPVVLSSVLISNATCGNATGTIILNLGSGAYQFNWTPSVSVSNVASNLQAGTYEVEIIRADDPSCLLDTTIIVNNSNGPSIQVANVTPANCLASNGQITLAPATLNFSWSNGATGPVNVELSAGCYYVTATNASNCYTVQKICVSNTNPLQAEAVVLQNAKCGLPTGAANIVVQGGSGQYVYTLGAQPPFTGLAAGNYSSIVTDIATSCADEVFFSIEDIPVTAVVELDPVPVKCPGQTNGSVGISITPGEHFDLPYDVVIQDQNGLIVQSGNLAPGTYSIQISDSSGCALPTESFVVGAPPLFVSQALVISGTCETGGQILLTLSGGTGAKTVDWLDLPGATNPQNRQNLDPGLYSALVSDSLACSFTVAPILVTSGCIRTDTFALTIPVNMADTFCMELPVGVQPDAAMFSLVGNGSGSSGNSAFGSWVLQPGGCLIYTAGAVDGMNVDTICLARSINQPGLSDTVCVLVSIIKENCAPVYAYTPDASGLLTWTVADCSGDTVFCTSIPNAASNLWTITDHGLAVVQVSCGTTVGFTLDTGLHMLQLRTTQSVCTYHVRVQVNCVPVVPSDTTYAVADEIYTNRGSSIDIPILENDVVLGITGNIGAVGIVEFLSAPDAGTYVYNPATGVLTFNPDDKQCGVVEFVYEITDSRGVRSQTTVSITIICDKILIFNGISPNGDSLNDEWHMPGIDQYSNNEVRVYNRWGQLVFERRGYTNATGWDGRWNGQDLPDGTYFYMIDLKDGSAVLSGYLQILR